MARLAESSALEVRGASKRYGGLEVLANVDITVRSGSCYGLVGPNGAGKTTLLNAISGIVRLDSGTVSIGNVDITRLPPHRRVRHGLARTFQTVRLVPGRSVLDQVVYGAYGMLEGSTWPYLMGLPSARRRIQDQRDRAGTLLELVGMADQAATIAEVLPYGDRRRVEIARALMTEPSVLLLDEPVAGMGVAEWTPLVDLLRRLSAEGLTVVVIEHNMRFVERCCERVMVLNSGHMLAEGPPRECLRADEVRAAYFGTGWAKHARHVEAE
jgi:branched-chain amino acid transport system ATP-binding protein